MPDAQADLSFDGCDERFDELGRKIIVCYEIDEKKLKIEQQLILRIFYWASYYGRVNAVEMMVELLRWSPMMKSYKQRDVLSAAILGGQENVVLYLMKKKF